MDWLWIASVGATIFAAGVIGQLLGYRDGLREGRALERLERRIDEITETVRVEARR